jgi:hypothetical protein
MADNDGANRFSPREEAFIFHYVRTGNAKQSYQIAGYKCTEASAYELGSRMLRRVDILREVERQRQELKAAKKIDLQWFVDRLTREINFDPGEVLEVGNGDLKVRQEIGRKKALKYFEGMSFSSSSGEGGDSYSVSFKNKDTLARMKFLAELLGLTGDKQGTNKPDAESLDSKLLESLQKHSKGTQEPTDKG